MFFSCAITISCLASILDAFEQPCIANQYLSGETVCCELPGQRMHGYFGCNAAAERGSSAFLGTPQASPSCLEEKKNRLF